MGLDISKSAITGISKGLDGMREAADKIASASNLRTSEAGSGNSAGLTEGLVELKIHSQVVTSSIRVVEVNDSMVKSLLDVVV